MTPSQIPPRLWLIQSPHSWRCVALVESHTPDMACDRAARLLGLGVGSFRSMATDSGRRIDAESSGEVLFATDVTGILQPTDASRLDEPDVLAKIEGLDEMGAFIAPIED